LLKQNESTLKPAWSYAGASYVTTVNNLILTISDIDDKEDNDNNGNSGGNIAPKTLVIIQILIPL
jgi:hypothetical protein